MSEPRCEQCGSYFLLAGPDNTYYCPICGNTFQYPAIRD